MNKQVIKYTVVKALSKVIVFYMLVIPMMVSTGITAFSYPQPGNLMFNVSMVIMSFSLIPALISFSANWMVKGLEKLKEKYEKTSKQKYKVYYILYNVGINIVFLIFYLLLTFPIFSWWNILIGIGFLILSYFYLILVVYIANKLEKFVDKKLADLKGQTQ